MSIVDGTNLPDRVAEILRKKPEDRTLIEQAVLDAYNEKFGPGGAEKVAEVSNVERVAPSKQKILKICILNGGETKCDEGSLFQKCPICNPVVKI